MSMTIPHVAVDGAFALEECPFETIAVDVTHRCNMACRNCYVPNRSIPDLDAKWLSGIFARLPRGRFIRLVGAEPTMRDDLPELVRDVRRHGHHPVVLTNGLKLADRSYVQTLKAAGMHIAYLSFNGGFDESLYEAIDGASCAALKRRALENLTAEHIFTSLGMIVVRDLNEREVRPVLRDILQRRNVREFKLRSIGAMGRYMNASPLSLDELLGVFAEAAGVEPGSISRRERTHTSHDFRYQRLRVQLTVWPDLGSKTRGRLTPDGMVAPAMEHIIANEFGY